MDDTRCRDYFLHPSGTYQRQYEALRAYFVERQSLEQIAAHFGFTYEALRSLVRDFRTYHREEAEPPFSRPRASVARSVPRPASARHKPRSPRSPTDDGSI